MLTPLLLSGVVVVAPVAGPGVDHTTIYAAVNAAANGDIVLVRDGGYFGDVGLPSSKNIAIVADTAALVQSSQAVWGFHTLQPSHTAVVRGFQLNGFFAGLPYTTTTLQLGAGNVFVEDCAINGSHSCVRVDAPGWLALTRCTAIANSAAGPSATSALGVALATGVGTSSLATVHASTLRGGIGLYGQASAIWYAIDAPVGSQWIGSLIASHSTIEGGAGAGAKPGSFGACIESEPGSALAINGTAHFASTTVLAGAQGPLLGGCAAPPTPPALIGGTAIVHAGSAPLVSSSRVTREGGTLSITLETTTGDFAVLLAATNVNRIELDDFVGVLVNPAASLMSLGIVGPSGSAGASAVIQDLGAGVEGAVLFLQGASVDLSTLSVRLSNVSVATLLDASL